MEIKKTRRIKVIKEQKELLIKRMESMQNLIPDTIKAMDALPELEFLNMYTVLDPGMLRLRMDYNIKKYRLLRRHLGSDWIYLKKRFNNLTGGYYIMFIHKSLDVILDVELELSEHPKVEQMCKLIKVDEREPGPIYKVVCE